MPKEFNMHLFNPEVHTLPQSRKARRALAAWQRAKKRSIQMSPEFKALNGYEWTIGLDSHYELVVGHYMDGSPSIRVLKNKLAYVMLTENPHNVQGGVSEGAFIVPFRSNPEAERVARMLERRGVIYQLDNAWDISISEEHLTFGLCPYEIWGNTDPEEADMQLDNGVDVEPFDTISEESTSLDLSDAITLDLSEES